MDEAVKNKKIADLEIKLAIYKERLAEKKKWNRGIKHEDSLSELRYMQYMVARDMVDGLERELNKLRDTVIIKR